MERISILIDKKHFDLKEVEYTIEKAPEFLCEHCGIILSSKQSLKCHIVVKYSEKATTYQCSNARLHAIDWTILEDTSENTQGKPIPQRFYNV